MYQMTDKEAYDLLVKYSGEKGISLVKEMIHVAGIDKALENIEWAYKKNGQQITEEYRQWMRQAFNYLVQTTTEAN
jgi:hypothetical protein